MYKPKRSIKDLHLFSQVVIVTANVEISRCYFAEDDKTCSKGRAARGERFFVLTRPIQFSILWRGLTLLLVFRTSSKIK